MDEQAAPDFSGLTVDIVSAYVGNNSVPRNDLPALIASVHAALQGLTAPKEVQPEKLEPPVPIKKSVTPDFIISLEDGRRYKSLKRHLTGRGLTPEQYREKWGLAKDYPMVAPNYAKQRSELAKSLGLGQQRRKAAAPDAAVQEEMNVDTAETAGEDKPRRRAAPKRKAA